MNNLLTPNTQCTDPDTLQFCLPISDREFWYCEPNCCHDKLLPESGSVERIIYDTLCGYPKELIRLSSVVIEVEAFISNSKLWRSSNIDIDDLTQEEQLELLDDYGYSWDDFGTDIERNQIICENYFEENYTDFTNN